MISHLNFIDLKTKQDKILLLTAIATSFLATKVTRLVGKCAAQVRTQISLVKITSSAGKLVSHVKVHVTCKKNYLLLMIAVVAMLYQCVVVS